MIDFCQWRASIGLWNCCKWPCSNGKSTGGSLKVLDQSRISAEKRSKPTISLILLFTILLILAGDVELNPGPKTGADSTIHINKESAKYEDPSYYQLEGYIITFCICDMKTDRHMLLLY